MKIDYWRMMMDYWNLSGRPGIIVAQPSLAAAAANFSLAFQLQGHLQPLLIQQRLPVQTLIHTGSEEMNSTKTLPGV